MAKLELDRLAKTFGKHQVIDGLSFDVKDKEFVSVLGPSGSGKSTLFHLIGGLYQPDDGDIRLGGKSIVGQKGAISYMPQSSTLFPWRTLEENVLLGAEIAGNVDRDHALSMIEKAGLSGFESAYPHQLSGGMKQRASFIRSLLSPQSLICLDEPFSALDEFTRQEMQQWLLSTWEEHQRSILFITHNIEEAIFLSDRVIVLSDRPATMRKEFQIPFARPRDPSLILSTEFLEWKKEIHHSLRTL
ncbi:ABC transporter ATP-binding protein [Halobacillus locisalis]|uniref:ABC transporter ATP-binding protein n=1 Tax=Halobacillus locisalis TaxID=220753 RepID=A0A838CXM6_9BACI|nr:ABC transporter ATP-binding protein [Halobacillus locisalis]MBA2176356.1 ABC transporter ATP-binding protein [Halobacillus locisalis]